VNGLETALVLSVTVLLALTIGIYGAYAAVISILYALAPQTSRTRVLIPSETHASGD
jgi:hypothetical protein